MLVELEQIKDVLASIAADCQEGAKAFHFARLSSLASRAESRSDAIQAKLLPELELGLSRLNLLLMPQELEETQDDEEKSSSSLFQGLIEHINSFDVKEIEKAALGLDALLFDLDEDKPATTESTKTENLQSDFRTRAKELKSLQFYREQLGKVITENMVRQVIKEDPENAGPLNPQRLLVRTIGEMKKLSPAYVNRLVPYYDTLLWLEQTGEQLSTKLNGKSSTRKGK